MEREAPRPLLPGMKVPTFDGHLKESNTDLRRCSMEYTLRRKLTREFKLEAVRQAALSEKPKAVASLKPSMCCFLVTLVRA
jgi:hypothetical protein